MDNVRVPLVSIEFFFFFFLLSLIISILFALLLFLFCFDQINPTPLFQALYHLSALSYSSHLLNLLRTRTPLALGSREEIEIRGNSIWAVELIRREIQHMVEEDSRKGDKMKVNAILLDFYIWDHAKEIQGDEEIVAHRTRSIYY